MSTAQEIGILALIGLAAFFVLKSREPMRPPPGTQDNTAAVAGATASIGNAITALATDAGRLFHSSGATSTPQTTPSTGTPVGQSIGGDETAYSNFDYTESGFA